VHSLTARVKMAVPLVGMAKTAAWNVPTLVLMLVNNRMVYALVVEMACGAKCAQRCVLKTAYYAASRWMETVWMDVPLDSMDVCVRSAALILVLIMYVNL